MLVCIAHPVAILRCRRRQIVTTMSRLLARIHERLMDFQARLTLVALQTLFIEGKILQGGSLAARDSLPTLEDAGIH